MIAALGFFMLAYKSSKPKSSIVAIRTTLALVDRIAYFNDEIIYIIF